MCSHYTTWLSIQVLLALRRLKGTSNNKKEKMPAERKQLFDQLTEDAMALMESGEFSSVQFFTFFFSFPFNIFSLQSRNHDSHLLFYFL